MNIQNFVESAVQKILNLDTPPTLPDVNYKGYHEINIGSKVIDFHSHDTCGTQFIFFAVHLTPTPEERVQLNGRLYGGA